ncbi:MucR family transcriptional regulator [Kitasatospora sp. SolWspMP-SS2h]|nr:MucR family transcriptional regulator [Kitasatospora sp. SolWspMP-SS2h]
MIAGHPVQARESGAGAVLPPAERPDFGVLVRDEGADRVVCHVCGRGFRALGSHLRAHGLSAAEYRTRYGLRRRRSLSSRELNRSRSTRQTAAYRTSAEMRENFAAGQAMARSGELARAAVRQTSRSVPEELTRARAEQLLAGRRTRSAQAGARAREAAARLGFATLPDALAELYTGRQLSIEQAARQLGIGRVTLRDLLADHGIPLRPTGVNSPAGRRARVTINDERTARLVGTTDIAGWLRERRSAGATLRELAEQTGRSIPWIVDRLGK